LRSGAAFCCYHADRLKDPVYWRIAIHTRLSPVEAETALRRLVGPKRARWDRAPQDPRPFTGRVSEGTFEFRRIVIGRNDFRPVITGRIDATDGGTIVHATVRTKVIVALTMTLWMAAAVVSAVTGIPRALAEGNLRDVVLLSLFFALGAALIGTGYVPEARRAVKLMRQSLET
jgi:hypothetical protein